MFTTVKELIYIDNKKHHKMKKFKLMQGDTCQITTNTSIFPIEHYLTRFGTNTLPNLHGHPLHIHCLISLLKRLTVFV